jgi:hypothetical protein
MNQHVYEGDSQMRNSIGSLLVALAMIVVGVDAQAGQFKNLNNTATLPVNGLVRASSSPQNTGSAGPVGSSPTPPARPST